MSVCDLGDKGIVNGDVSPLVRMLRDIPPVVDDEEVARGIGK